MLLRISSRLSLLGSLVRQPRFLKSPTDNSTSRALSFSTFVRSSSMNLRLPFLQQPSRTSLAPGAVAPGATLQVRGMKTRSSVKRLCEGCKAVRRKNRVFIICDKNPKHKQRQGK